MAKYCVTLIDEFKKQLASKRRDKVSKEMLFLQDNADPDKVAITH
jgi:hypothetical protein